MIETVKSKYSSWLEEKDTDGKPKKICKFCCRCCTRKKFVYGTAIFLVVLFFLYITCPIWPVPFADYEQSRKSDAIIMYCERTIADADAYSASWSAYAEFTQSASAGVLAMFSFVQHDDATRALQLFFFTGADGWLGMTEGTPPTYVGTSETDFCQVLGGWNDALAAKYGGDATVHYAFEKKFGGFIRDPSTEPGKNAYSMDGPLMILMSKRMLKPGEKVFKAYGPAFTHLADIMYTAAPGVIASIEVPDGRDPEAIWVCRMFNDYPLGFLAHLYGSPLITPTVLMTVMPYWASPIFPIANSFSNGWMMNAAIAGFPGNAVYGQYHYEDGVLGPMPDLKKAIA